MPLSLRVIVTGVICVATSSVAIGQETPPPTSEPTTATTPPPAKPDVIVVNGIVQDTSAQIDRQVYEIRHDPQVDSAAAIDILGKLPSVSVSTNGRVALLGSTSVTVMIDGRKVSANDPSIRLMPASQIDRIEVMTNPSAEFAAESGGIINIITKRRHGAGLRGQYSVTADSLGSEQVSLSPSWTSGDLSINGTLTATRNIFFNRSTRVTTSLLTDPPEQTLQTSREDDDNHSLSGKLQASLKLDEHDTMTLALNGYSTDAESRTRTQVSSDATRYLESIQSPDTFTGGDASLSYERQGKVAGESLALAASTSQYSGDTDSSILDAFENGDPSARYEIVSRFSDSDTKLTGDYKRPLWKKGKLSTGLSWERDANSQSTSSSNFGNGTIPDLETGFSGSRSIGAAYATFEYPFGKWTVLPGLRMEADRFHIAGDVDAQRSRTEWFPSLHISRDLPGGANLMLSATRRIQRPSIGALDPAVSFSSTTQASAGNPDLEPITLTNYEAKLVYKLGAQTLTTTVYDHESDNSWENFVQLTSDGVQLSTLVNGDGGWDRGAEFSLTGPLAPRWRYTATANLFDRNSEVLVDGVAGRNTSFTYSGNAKLEYTRKNARGETADQAELAVVYSGPRNELQGATDAYWRTSLTWRKALTGKAALVLTLQDLFSSSRYTQRVTTEDFTDVWRVDPQGLTAKLTLTYRLGAAEK